MDGLFGERRDELPNRDLDPDGAQARGEPLPDNRVSTRWSNELGRILAAFANQCFVQGQFFSLRRFFFFRLSSFFIRRSRLLSPLSILPSMAVVEAGYLRFPLDWSYLTRFYWFAIAFSWLLSFSWIHTSTRSQPDCPVCTTVIESCWSSQRRTLSRRTTRLLRCSLIFTVPASVA